MEKRPLLRADRVTAVLAVYVAGFIVVFLMLEAERMLGETSTFTVPLTEAALWPLNLLRMVM